ncbi:unnamed protein product [Cuscuta campestris]|uniref:Uncharacterized protein n=1 Tax=Cuscuta campestris TaxID=132261 RepID=A0A484M1I9_9ASTE|nr:unnamed protein product [Cuscuta campestris]
MEPTSGSASIATITGLRLQLNQLFLSFGDQFGIIYKQVSHFSNIAQWRPEMASDTTIAVPERRHQPYVPI